MKQLNTKKIGHAAIIFALVLMFITGCTKKDATETNPTPVVVDTAPTITGISNAGALANSVITITGTNFGSTTAGANVTFNGVAAAVNAVSATEIVVTVPTTATTGKVAVTVGGKTATSTSNFIVKTGTVSTLSNTFVEHVAIDATGNVYGDAMTAIYKTTPAGVTTLFAGTATASASNPIKSAWGIAADAAGNIYLPDLRAYVIHKVSPAGVITTFAGGGSSGLQDGTGTSAKFVYPKGIAIDGAGNLYIADNYRVRKITPAGVVTTLAGSGVKGDVNGQGAAAQFGALEGIAVDATGNVYVTDLDYKRIRKITAAGAVTTLAGSGTAGFADGAGTTAQFFYPQGMAVDAAGNVFVSDSDFLGSYYAIRMINKNGLVSTFIKGTGGPIKVGPTNVATVSFPDGIAFDTAGNMYIASTNDGIISKVTIN